MSKEKLPYFPYYPKDLLSDINWRMMNYVERGMYWELISVCWLEGSLPADLGALARLLQIGPEQLKEAWKMIGKCFQVSLQDSSRLVHPRLEFERQKRDEWTKKCSIGGKRSAHKRKHKREISPEQGTCDLLASKAQVKGNIAFASSFANNTGKSKNDLPAANGKPEDPVYVVFRDLHQEKLGAPYQYQKQDFVWIAKLKRDLKLTNGDLPQSWKQTCTNYLDTPQGKLTLSDLISRYAIFLNSPLDKFGKPVSRPAQAKDKPKSTVTFTTDAEGKPIALITHAKETKQ